MSIIRVMVYLKKGDTKKLKAIEKSSARVLASYNNGLLIEVDEAKIQNLTKKGYSIEVQQQDKMIRLRAVQFDTSDKIPDTPAALSRTIKERAVNKNRDFWIVQFVGPMKAEWGKKIKQMGARIGDYVPENAFIIEMSDDIADKIKELPFVGWIGPYEPAYKISPSLMGHKKSAIKDELATRSFDTASFTPKPEGNLTILVHAASDLIKVVDAVKSAGGSIIASEGNTIRASLNTAFADQIAKMVEVKWIEPYEPPVLFNNVAAQIMGVQPVWDNHDLDGSGQIVAVADSGLDTGNNDNTMHADFRGRIKAIKDRVGDGAGDVNSGHGTHVAGSVLGNGAQSGGTIRGMAPAAKLVFQAIERNTTGDLSGIPADYNILFKEARDEGARIHTNSWGRRSDFGQYMASSEDIDEFMWNNKDSIILFSAGNNGRDNNSNGVIDPDSLAPQATAKNCITVGATESNRSTGGLQNTYGFYFNHFSPPPVNIPFPVTPISTDLLSDNPEGMAAFSSRGPCDDGRLKPDVVAPGTNILSVRSSAVTGVPLWGDLPATDPLHGLYCWSGGTSMSTPLVAGTVALIRQYMMGRFSHNPSGALLKALLIHGAVPITGQYMPPEVGTAPDNSQGWGRVNLTQSLFPQHPSIWRYYDSPVLLDTGDQYNVNIPVKNTGVPIMVTLAWTDFPSSPSAGGRLVNELRLEVIDPGGGITTGAPADNNVQKVIIANPIVGTYNVRVTGINIRTVASLAKKQGFALVIGGGLDFIDLYIKDNSTDDGISPTIQPSFQSPDISMTINKLQKKVLVFVKVHNRGSRKALNAKVSLYWTKVPNILGKSWNTVGIYVNGRLKNTQLLDVPGHSGINDGEATTSAFELNPVNTTIGDIKKLEKYFLIAVVDHKSDPVTAKSIHWENNAAAKQIK